MLLLLLCQSLLVEAGEKHLKNFMRCWDSNPCLLPATQVLVEDRAIITVLSASKSADYSTLTLAAI